MCDWRIRKKYRFGCIANHTQHRNITRYCIPLFYRQFLPCSFCQWRESFSLRAPYPYMVLFFLNVTYRYRYLSIVTTAGSPSFYCLHHHRHYCRRRRRPPINITTIVIIFLFLYFIISCPCASRHVKLLFCHFLSIIIIIIVILTTLLFIHCICCKYSHFIFIRFLSLFIVFSSCSFVLNICFFSDMTKCNELFHQYKVIP